MKVGIAISTFFPHDSVREVRLRMTETFVERAIAQGHAVFFTDRSPDDRSINSLVAAGAKGGRISNSQFPCLGRAESLQRALDAGCEYILLTEPEKVDLVPLVSSMQAFAEERHLDILFPTRSEESMASHPTNMQTTEPLGNARIAECTGLHYDWFMGAQLLSRRAAERY